MNKADRIQQEARALWLETFGEQPAPDLDGRQMLRILLERLEPVSYSRLTQAGRLRNVTFPR